MKKALIVEDNHIAAICAKMKLEPMGFDVHIVNDGETAIEQYQANIYDIVLMDLNLGEGITGYQTTQHFRAIEANLNKQPVPIIAFTGDAKAKVYNDC